MKKLAGSESTRMMAAACTEISSLVLILDMSSALTEFISAVLMATQMRKASIATTSRSLPEATMSENTRLLSFGPSSPSSVTASVARPISTRSAVCRHSAI